MAAALLGVVASGHPRVSGAAADILRAGGNAFDAALAAGFAAPVAEPMLASLGGGGFLLARTAESRELLFDFFVDTPGRGLPESRLEPHFVPMTVRFPGSEQVFNLGRGSVAVPGNIRGFLRAHAELGCLPLREVVAPAVELARAGVELNEIQAYAIELLVPINTHSPEARALWAPEGRTPGVGDRLRNPDFADFLETFAVEGDRVFYEGELAARIARDMREGQGLLTQEDLRSYEVVAREPLVFSHRGHRLLTNPPPSSGGSLIAQMLGALAAGGPESRAVWGSGAHLSSLASAMHRVESRRGAGGTTHVSVTDARGNAASLSLSNGEGSGYVVPDTGIMLNNMLGEDDLHPHGFHASAAGERVPSMMSPSLLMRDGEVRLIVGSGGSKRIRTALLQVISHVGDFDLAVDAAIEAPRLHWDGALLQVEPGFPAEGVTELRATWPVNEWPERNLYFGGVHAVTPRHGAGDPRRGGHAIVVA